ncbi:hypothetical protein [Tropicibacter oceani]|uniref:Uncharacterized protein n=1 Tax=Tropicibacter oceani TaxID=3058420 RepID=A0ABY8QJE0_9RHOB|nr:hypothetical protein [Tropicibacter oceani]WGW04116.1 hypothetical protein QF118_00835 [Tropicibacter oceani]
MFAALAATNPACQNRFVQYLPEFLPQDPTLTCALPPDNVPVERSTPRNRTGAGQAGSHQKLGCLATETGCAPVQGETVCDASRRPPRP